jgi:hypothetical protein
MSVWTTIHRSRSVILKSAMSLIALGFILVHILKPSLKVDSITIALIVIAMLPWLYSVIESAKFPGGYEIKFRDISKAGEKIGGGGVVAEMSASAAADSALQSTLERVQSIDPNLAVAGLRIEIEKSVRKIADAHGVPSRGPLTNLVNTLGTRGVFPGSMVDGLKTLIQIGNSAVHGASVDPSAAEWAIIHSQQIIRSLNRIGGDSDETSLL